VGASIEGVGELGFNCPASIGYAPSPDGNSYDMVRPIRIGIGAIPPATVDGKTATVTIEIVGSNKKYARDEKTVTLRFVDTFNVDAGVR
jgi:hypothetical protein